MGQTFKKTVPDLWVLRLFEAKDKPKEDQVEMPEVNPVSSELIGNLIFLEAPNFGVPSTKGWFSTWKFLDKDG